MAFRGGQQDFEIVSGVLMRCRGGEETVVVPEGTVEIAGKRMLGRVYDANSDRYISSYADGAFTGLRHIKDVRLPSSLRRIGAGAFADCAGLLSVTIPEGILSIEPDTFRDCTNLQAVFLPRTLGEIGDHAFDNCMRLQTVRLPERLRKIGAGAFSYCVSLRELRIPDGAEIFGNMPFEGCRALTDVTFHGRLSEDVFRGSKWYIDRQIKAGRCPVCGAKLSLGGDICENLSCPTNYGKWEH